MQAEVTDRCQYDEYVSNPMNGSLAECSQHDGPYAQATKEGIGRINARSIVVSLCTCKCDSVTIPALSK